MANRILLEEAIASITAEAEQHVASELREGGGSGEFRGLPVKVEFNTEDRSGRLIEPIVFIGPDSVEWPVPAGAWLDGASIPRAFWSIIGSPYGPRYREASVVHDHYCILRSRAWREVHRMFYAAMLTMKVSSVKARIMYYAVYRFGPRWPLPGVQSESAAGLSNESLSDRQAASILLDAEKLMENPMSAQEIEVLADKSRTVF